MTLAQLLEAMQSLKRIPRSGWIYAGVDPASVESVAEHSFSVAFLTLFLAEELVSKGEKVDVERALKMAILHDLSEALTFDISKKYLEFMGKEGRVMKHELEASANAKLLSAMPRRLKGEAEQLLREHELGTSREAMTVVAADKLDLLIQLNTYRNSGYSSATLDSMQRNVRLELKAMKQPLIQEVLAHLNARLR